MRTHRRTISAALFAASWLASVPLCGCVQSMFFQPDHTLRGSPADSGMAFKECRFSAQGGPQLTGWFIPATTLADSRKAEGTIIHFHGNAQNITAHWHQVKWLARSGFNVFVFDYRGYGQSEGSPTVQGLAADCRAAIEYVRQLPQADPDRLVVFGQSLGGANAIVAVAQSSAGAVRAVAIESAFASYSSIADQKLPLAGLLMDDALSPDAFVGSIHPTPILFMHGEADGLIGCDHSLRLFELAGQPKQLLLVPQKGHLELMDATGPGSAREVLLQFFRAALAQPRSLGKFH